MLSLQACMLSMLQVLAAKLLPLPGFWVLLGLQQLVGSCMRLWLWRSSAAVLAVAEASLRLHWDPQADRADSWLCQ
jgi:hypothetical protein